jgi:prephenate dehydrogenase
MSSPRCDTLAVIGVGLIGGSLAIALRQAGFCRRIVGCGRQSANLEQAVALGVIDAYSTDPASAVAGADLVFVAVPLGAMRAVFEQIAPALKLGAVVSDGGSAKGSVVRDAEAAFAGSARRFVPGHPIAGNEKSGVSAAFGELYRGRRVILTPTAQTDADGLALVRAMWEAAGAEVEEMAVEHHDQVLAATSHLPHMLAFGLVDSLARLSDRVEIFRYAAGGFRDFTRIASSDPVMWKDICTANAEALLEALKRFEVDMQDMHAAVEQRDAERLLEIFSRAKAARDEFIG